MSSRAKLGILVLLLVTSIVGLSRVINLRPSTYSFEFADKNLSEIIRHDLEGKEGKYSVYIESLGGFGRHTLAVNEPFPAASLYKLVLLAAALKSVEEGKLSLDQTVSGTRSHLEEVLGGTDFGYEDTPKELEYSVEEILERIGAISDNFASIMLTEKLRQLYPNDPLAEMAKELGMENTSFAGVPVTTAADIGNYFKLLYQGKVVSSKTSARIMEILDRSKIEDRIPAALPEDVKVIHKTGELSKVRHDAGVVFLEDPAGISSQSALPKKSYIIVLLSKDLQFEDDGVETLAQISRDVYEYFKGKEGL